MRDPKHERANNKFFIEIVVFSVVTLSLITGVNSYANTPKEIWEPQVPVMFVDEPTDVMLPDPPEQHISDELKAQIDREAQREWESDYPEVPAEPVEESWDPYYELADGYSGYEAEEGGYDPSNGDYVSNFKGWGTGYDGTYSYSWYSQNVLPGGGLYALNGNGRHVGDNDFIYDGDGYIAVAMDGVEQGTVISTPWGEAKVYDSVGESDEYTGHVDVYTNY